MIAGYPLPLCQASLLLISSIFPGRLGVELNRLQKKLQDTSIDTQFDTRNKNKLKKSIRFLNNLDAQIQLYIGIFDRLNIKNPTSRKRVFETVLALQSKRDDILRQLEPIRPRAYKTLAIIQQDINNSFRINSLDDYKKLDKLFINLVGIIASSKESDTKQDLESKFSEEISRVAKSINPSRASLLYNLEEFSKYLLNWSDIAGKERSSEDSIDNLINARNELAHSFNKIFTESWNKDQEIENRSQKINSLEDTINRLCSQTSSAKQELNRALDLNRQKQAQLDSANKKADDLKVENSNLQHQINTLNNQIETLSKRQPTFEQRIQQLQRELREANDTSSSLPKLQDKLLQVRQERDSLRNQIQNLQDQINNLIEKRFTGINTLGERRRNLSGIYIGNLSNTKTKYHFNIDCPTWWSLVGQYLYGDNVSSSRKRIVSSDNPRVFREAGLHDCDICSERR